MTAARRSSVLGPDETAGTVLRILLLIGAMLAAEAILSAIPWPANLRHVVVPTGGALLVAAMYIWRPSDALFGLATYMMFSETTAWYLGGQVKPLDEVSLLLLVPIALWRALPQWRSWISLPREASILVALAAGVVSSLAASVPVNVWVPAMLLLSKVVVAFYVVMLSRVSVNEAKAGFWVLIGAAIVVALLGVAEMLNTNGFQQFLGLNHYVRLRSENVVVKSIFVHPALFGYFSTTVALLLLARYLVTRRLRWLLLSLMVATGPFLSARRRAILALAAGAFAALIASPRMFTGWRQLVRTWIPVALGSVLLIGLFLSLLTGLYALTWERYGIGVPGLEPTPTPGVPIVEPVGEGENQRARLALYEGSVEIARDKFPLGGGMGRFGSWMSRAQYSPLYHAYGLDQVRGLKPESPTAATDTFWPQILGELGIFGLLGYIGFMATIAWMVWREAGRDDGPELRILRLGAGMVFAQTIVESAASAMYNSPSRMYLFAVIVGTVASIAWRRRASG